MNLKELVDHLTTLQEMGYETVSVDNNQITAIVCYPDEKLIRLEN